MLLPHIHLNNYILFDIYKWWSAPSASLRSYFWTTESKYSFIIVFGNKSSNYQFLDVWFFDFCYKLISDFHNKTLYVSGVLLGFRVGNSLSIHYKLQQFIQEHNFGQGESWESESFVNRWSPPEALHLSESTSNRLYISVESCCWSYIDLHFR